MSPTKTKPAQKQYLDLNDLDNLEASQSEFPDSKVAVGAAMTYIQELQKSLSAPKYQEILDLLNSYYTHSLTEKDVYINVKRVLKGVEGEEKLVKGFERFLPAGAVVAEEEEKEGVKAGKEVERITEVE